MFALNHVNILNVGETIILTEMCQRWQLGLVTPTRTPSQKKMGSSGQAAAAALITQPPRGTGTSRPMAPTLTTLTRRRRRRRCLSPTEQWSQRQKLRRWVLDCYFPCFDRRLWLELSLSYGVECELMRLYGSTYPHNLGFITVEQLAVTPEHWASPVLKF